METVVFSNPFPAPTTIQITELSAFTTSLYDTSVAPGIALDFLTGNSMPQWLPLILGTVTVFGAVFAFTQVKYPRGLGPLSFTRKFPRISRRNRLNLVLATIYALLIILTVSYLADATLTGIFLGLLVSIPLVIYRFRIERR
jgi:NAD/NADP transhydrogenase beta subunit